MKLLDTASLFTMVLVLVALLHTGGVVSLSPAPLVQAVMPESEIVQAEIEQRERARAIEKAEREHQPTNEPLAHQR